MVSRYGGEHQALRKRWAPIVATGTVVCTRYGDPLFPDCPGLIDPAEPWELGHDDWDRSIYTGPEHARTCNRRAGGLKGSRQRRVGSRTVELRNRCAGVDIARDRTRTAVVVAGLADHPTEGEVIAASLHLFAGVATLDQTRQALGDDPLTVAVNGLGHMRSLADQLRTRYDVVEAKAQDVVDANARLLDVIRGRRLKILHAHPELTAAVQHAKTRSLLEGQALDKRGAEKDLAPLAALELAVWCLESQSHVRPFIIS